MSSLSAGERNIVELFIDHLNRTHPGEVEKVVLYGSIIGLFNQQFVKTGILPRDYGKFKNSRDLRQAGDYDDFYLVSREEALAAVENASRFIKGIRLFLIKHDDADT